MAEIKLKQIAHSYLKTPVNEEDWALKELDQVWMDGGAYALLGPSGCGKTTLLNVMSGLVIPTRGRVSFNGEDVTERRTEARNIAQVFQFPVIYDTMSVFDNLAFPLRNRKVDEATVRKRVHEVAEMLELEDELNTRARRLTADAKQKISLGRGLVRSDVAAILFDEPLTVIDPQAKWLLRRKLKEIHERFKLTLIYVTHDQAEALTFADQVVVMNEGQVLQVGTPQELFESPAHRFIGYFIGSPGMNFLPCEASEDGVRVAGQTVRVPESTLEKIVAKDQRLELGVRPEFVRPANNTDRGSFQTTIRAVDDLGNYKIITCMLEDLEIKMKLPEDQALPEVKCRVSFDPKMIRVYADGQLIC
jgi:glycerol transport system ATP-binding protein